MGLQDQVRAAVDDDQLPCVRAHNLAGKWGMTPEALGAAATEVGIRITRCKNGLFGYGPKGTPSYRVVQAADHVPEGLTVEVQAALVDGRLPCRAAWALAGRHGLTIRLDSPSPRPLPSGERGRVRSARNAVDGCGWNFTTD
jgi:hypothetical protein